MNSFIDVNFKFDISVGVPSFRNTKFEFSIYHINYQLFFDISKIEGSVGIA